MTLRGWMDAQWRFLRRRAGSAALFASLAVVAAACPAFAGPYIWDEDEDRVDDRMEQVNALGFQFSFELGDTLLRQRFMVIEAGTSLLYGVYVVFDHPPTTTDLAHLALIGMPALHRIEAVPAVRSLGSFAQVQLAAAMSGVERVEAVPILYPELYDNVAAAGVRDPSGRVFPTWPGAAGGRGVVVAFLDTGINDAAQGQYPGHESLAGRCLGGAVFTFADSNLDTPKNGSVNPTDQSGSHGTHVAGIALGSGGSSGYAAGVAPAARFIDVQVLNQLGLGTGVPEALDWCIANRQRDWGAMEPGFTGIDVINLSLSGLDESDGNDLAARLARRAAELGIVVVASMGNGGQANTVPSPAAADRVLAVGAWDVQRTGPSDDDVYPMLNNYGPRASDGDIDSLDELKPDLLAPGIAVLSADGDLSSDGAQYRRMSGTSMASAFVAGAAALMLSEFPNLNPAALRAILIATARRNLAGLPVGSTGPDPRWLSPRGFGVIDLYAAWLEAQRPERTQVRRLTLGADASAVSATLWTQRERGATHLVFERAPDAGDAPGAFAAVDSVPAAGDSSLADPANLTSYSRTWPVGPGEAGQAVWVRVAYTEGGVRWTEPAARVQVPAGPKVATIEVTIVHNAYDHDVAATVEAYSAGSWRQFPLPGSGAAVSTDWVDGASTTGNLALTFRIEVPAGTAEAFLPPSAARPWILRVGDTGFLNRGGRVESYRVIWHAPGGDQVFAGGPTPLQTIENQTVAAQAPVGVLDATTMGSDGLRAAPNPVFAGGLVSFATAARAADLEVFDAGGRRVARSPFVETAPGRFECRWSARDGDGNPLPAGLYFARAGSRPGGGRPQVLRLVVLPF